MRPHAPAITAVLLLAVGTIDAADRPNIDRPNIIVIMADDLGYGDLGCYGQQLIETPHIDRLAAEGIRFTQAYAGSSVCAPTRAVLMTGLHNGHAPVRDNIPHYDAYLRDDDVTIAEVLKQAGYRTGGVGKWSLGDAGTVGRATNQGFDMWLGYLNQDHAHYYYTEYLDDNDGRLELRGNTKSHAHYSHDLMTRRTLEFICANKNESFFFYGAYTLPHFSSPSEDETRLPVPSDAPYSNRDDWTQKEKNYAAMVTVLDRDVGRIVALVDELGNSLAMAQTYDCMGLAHAPVISRPAVHVGSKTGLTLISVEPCLGVDFLRFGHQHATLSAGNDFGRIKGKTRRISKGAGLLAIQGAAQGVGRIFQKEEIALGAKGLQFRHSG